MTRRRRREGLRVDERDLSILYELERDARIPWRQLARKLGVSEATVYLRVRRLEESGILRGYSARIDLDRLGLSYRAVVMMRVLAGSISRIRESLRRARYVVRVLEVTGYHNFMVEVAAPSRDEFVDMLDRLTGMEGVVEALVLSVIREDWSARTLVGDVLGFSPGRGQARASGHSPG